MNETPAITLHRNGETVCELRLAGDVSAFHAGELHRAATEAGYGEKGVVVECGEVQSLDYTAGQILLALQQCLSVRNLPFRLAGVSPDLAKTLALVGLQFPDARA